MGQIQAAPQSLAPGASKALRGNGNAQSAQAAPTPATVRDPDRIRTLLKAVHGFSRSSLDATSTDIPAILQRFIDGSAESMLVKRQAIKALALYPTGENLDFVEQNMDSAPLGLKRLYVNTLGAFAESRPDRVATLLDRVLGDKDVTVRHSAVGVAAHLSQNPGFKAMLERRLGTETDSALKSEIRRSLAQPVK